MSEETVNNEVVKVDNEKLEKLKISLSNIVNRKSKILFCIPDSQTPNASVYEIYFQATTLKNIGYNVTILTEKDEYIKPFFVESELTELTHLSMSNPNINVGPEDILVIPELFSNIMEQTKELPCIRVGLLQSFDYMINSLVPGMDWSAFGIQNIVTTSNTLKNHMEDFYGLNKFNIKVSTVGIPSYFKKSDKPQKPVVTLIGRNPNEISKVVKLFYSKYPQYSWINFDTMLTQSKPPQPMSRVDFAERLRGNFAAVWIDRISSFGTFPLECMQSGVIPICLKPDITPEYIVEADEKGELRYKDNIGVWTTDLYSLPKLIGDVVTKFLDDTIGDDVYEKMCENTFNYTQVKSVDTIITAYESILNERAVIFENTINNFNSNE